MINFSELRLKMKGEYIPYQVLLTTAEWNEKRKAILERDHFECTQCGKGETLSDYDAAQREVWHFWVDFDVLVKQEDGTHKRHSMDFAIADKPYHMQVHHMRYIRNRLPWQYANEDLITLCNWCHSQFHEEYEVCVYAEDEETLLEGFKRCKRCNGVGSLPEYNHVQGGVCFSCGGERYEQPLVRVVL
ncbi:hypothetical protein [Pontibacter ruber]|uniref:HNH endonuclease n=1 Tax=Pontibacter ruber TaxID=1343895 RepID=A0ABW5D048_9BACT|nr:hypothetical protein [Pontibacter ruber]